MHSVAIKQADNYALEDIKFALRKIFDDLNLPREKPFSKFIKPGDKVFIKPNWVASRWRKSCSHVDTLYAVITHPAVIEAVCDFADEALGAEGEIIIGDNPSIDADFNELLEFTQINKLINKYNCRLSVKDLRPLICDDLKNYGHKNLMKAQSGDDQGVVNVNLGKSSLFYGINPEKFRGVFDERDETIKSHTGLNQLYTFSRSIYDADVYISIPKLKTHQKVGATLNLKGLVGTIANKNQLVHWRVGWPAINGDEYSSRENYEAGLKAKVKHRGAWPGNDTIWRMVCDLYKAFRLKARKYFCVIDGITAGEGQGPFCPNAKIANTLIASESLLAADIAAARYMNLNPEKIRYLKYFLDSEIALKDISVILNGEIAEKFFDADNKYLDFQVMPQWECIKYIT